MKKRVVITGIGLVTPIGIGREEFWKNALNGRSGIEKLNRFDTSGFPTSLGAEVKNFNPKMYIQRSDIRSLDITSQFGIAASILALKDADFKITEKNRDNIGIVIGTTLGTISFILNQQMILAGGVYSNVHKFLGHMALHNCLSADISIELGIRGVSDTVSSACISGISALDYAAEKIRTGKCSAMLAGGTESAFSQLPYAGLNIIRALTNSSVKPFDENADGTVLGEGAAILLIEELEHAKKRKTNIYCELGGIEVLCEGYNHFKRDQSAEIGVMTIDRAIRKSEIDKKKIGFINAHGMGLAHFDQFESKVLKKYFENFLRDIPVTSIKTLVGHPLAAASAMQVAATAIALKEGVIPHTLNTEKILKNSDINLVTKKPLEIKAKAALINSYAFGGKCAACVLKKAK